MVPAVLAGIVIVVMAIIIGGGAKQAKSISECRTLGGQCVFEMDGYQSEWTRLKSAAPCPEELQGYRWIALDARCKDTTGTEAACCQKATPIRRAAGTPIGPPPSTAPEVVSTMTTEERVETAETELVEGERTGNIDTLKNAYERARSEVYLAWNRPRPEGESPFGADKASRQQTIRSFGLALDARMTLYQEELAVNEDATSPYSQICASWSLLARTYVEGWWADIEGRQDAMRGFLEKKDAVFRDHPEHVAGEATCQRIQAVTAAKMPDIDACMTIIKNYREGKDDFGEPEVDEGIKAENMRMAAEEPQRIDQCEIIAPVLENDFYDVSSDGFRIEPFLPELL
jgi:hypothetical protein